MANIEQRMIGTIHQYTLCCYVCSEPAITYEVNVYGNSVLPSPKFNLQDIPVGWRSYGGGIVICTNPECIDTYHKSLNLTNKGD